MKRRRKEGIENLKKYLREKRTEWLRGKKRIEWREKGRKEPTTALKRNSDESAEEGGDGAELGRWRTTPGLR